VTDRQAGDWWLGFDIGGTRLKCGVVRVDGSVMRATVEDTAADRFERTLERMLAYGADAIAALGAPAGVGVALPGLVETGFGSRHLPGKVPGIEDVPLRDRLEAAFGAPARCVNDGAAATLAEWRFGVAAGHEDVVGFTLGTGVGCGVVMGGRLLTSRHLGAGVSFGHATIETGGRTCLCGNVGCAETRISATAVAGRLREYLARRVPSTLTTAYDADPSSVTFRSLIDGVEADDRVCLEVLAEFRRDLGAEIVTAVHAFDPEVVVLAGGPLHAADHFLPDVEAYVNRYAFRFPRDRHIPVLRARLEDQAGVLGAVALAMAEVGAGGASPPS
jgi:glucokinase